LAGYQHGEKHAATAKLTPETNTATTTQMPDFEAFLILTPMGSRLAAPGPTGRIALRPNVGLRADVAGQWPAPRDSMIDLPCKRIFS